MKSPIGLLLFFCLACATKTSNEPEKVEMAVPNKEALAENDSTQTLVLKWKSVSSSEWGNTYEFVDQSGNIFIADHLEISGFSENDNDYFTSEAVEGTPFSRYEIKDAVKEVWFDVKVFTTHRENEAAGDGSMKDVQIIVGVKPH